MERLLNSNPALPADDAPAAPSASWDKLVLGVLLAAVVLGTLLVTGMCLSLWEGHREAIDDAMLDTRNLAHVIAENARQGIRQIDLNLSTTEQVFRNWPTGKKIPDAQMNWLLTGRLKLMPDVNMLFIVDADGIRRFVAGVQPMPADTPMSDRPFYAWHRDHPSAELYIGAPVMSRTFNSLYIPVSRRLSGANGQFEGLIAAALEPRFLQSFYSSIDTGPDGLVAIFLRDSTLLARAPHKAELVGKQFPQIPLFRDELPRSPTGSYRRVTPSDGIARITSYSAVPGTDLVVLVGFAENNVFAGWRRQLLTSLIEMSAFIAALTILTFLLIRQLRRQQVITGNLAQSESRYRRLRDTANEGIWQVNGTHKTIFVNPRLCEMLGYGKDELMGRSPADFIHEDDQSRNLDMVARGRLTRTPLQYELRFRRKDASVLWTIISSVSTFDDSGVYTGVLAMLTDITARAEVEEEVRRHAIRLEGLHALDKAILQAQSSESIAAIGLTHLRNLVPCWGATVMAFDHEADVATVLALSRSADSPYDPGSRVSLADYGRSDIALMHTGQHQEVCDLGLVAKRTEVLEGLWLKGMRSYVRIPLLAEGELIGALNLGNDRAGGFPAEHIAIARSLADQMAIALRQAGLREEVERHAANLEQRVADRTAQLDAANRELEMFASSVSHDLRAPVRHISGYMGLLLAENPQFSTASMKYVDTINRSAERMDALIDALLELAHTSTRELNAVTFDMNAIVADVKEDLSPQCTGRAIEWKIASLATAWGDPSLIRVVMQNLMGNAVKYSARRERAVIEIESRRNESGEIEFVVRDNGAGFDMQHADKLFKPFSRLHSTREFEGTGVGLATVQRIVDRHGGYIVAQSRVGEGTEFRFTLSGGVRPVVDFAKH